MTGRGRSLTREVASWLAAHEARRPAEIWTSPLVRSVQTAEIVASALELIEGVSVKAELHPLADPAGLLALIAQREGPGPLAVVGHEPLLSEVAKLLLPGMTWPGFKKSGVLSVGWDGSGRAEMRFLLKPKKMLLIRDLDTERAE